MTADKNDAEGFDLKLAVLEQIPTPVMAVDKEFNVLFINPAGCAWLEKEWRDVKGKKCYDLFKTSCCGKPECLVRQAMAREETFIGRNELTCRGKTFNTEITAAPLKDRRGNIVGGLEYIIDISNRVKMENDLRAQTRTILELSTPVIKIWNGVLLLPLVGIVDTMRAQHIIENLLNAIVENEADVAILDLTGVPIVDTAVAKHIIKTVNAAKMLGAETILTGFSPDVSQTLVTLGVDLSNITTCGSLKNGISKAFDFIGKKVISHEG